MLSTAIPGNHLFGKSHSYMYARCKLDKLIHYAKIALYTELFTMWIMLIIPGCYISLTYRYYADLHLYIYPYLTKNVNRI